MSFRRFPVRFGRYILLDRIAAGGMAEVYRAKATGVEEFQRLLAIKTMLPSLTESGDFVRMFVDEAKVASQLNHPNIIQIHELGKLDEVLYIAMELIAGHDIGHILRVARAIGKPLPIAFSAYVIAKAAEGLDFAHHKTDPSGRPLNLVHRDVSPQNILVSFDGEVKVGDFGIAKSDSRAVKTSAGVVKGKIPYMAPEQVTGQGLDRRTDIFALGTVFYEMLTGQALFQGKNQFELMAAVRDVQVPPVSFRYPHVPDSMEAVLRRALSRRPEERFQTADELGQALNTFLIEGGALYGTRQAALVMDGLFHDEVGTALEEQRRYASVSDKDCFEDSITPQKTELFQSDFQAPATVIQSIEGTVIDRSEKGTVIDRPANPAIGDRAGKGSFVVPPTARFDDLGGPTLALSPRKFRPTLRGLKLPAMSSRLALILFGGTLLVTVFAAILIPGREPDRRAESTVGTSASVTVIPADTATPDAVVNPRPPTLTVTPPPAAVVTPTPTPTPAPSPTPKPVTAPSPPVASPTPEATPTPKPRPPTTPPAKAREPATGKFGFVSLRADGVSAAKVIIDGNDVGYSPIILLKVSAGRHKVRIIEQTADGPGRVKTMEINVTGKHTNVDPLRLVVPI